MLPILATTVLMYTNEKLETFNGKTIIFLPGKVEIRNSRHINYLVFNIINLLNAKKRSNKKVIPPGFIKNLI